MFSILPADPNHTRSLNSLLREFVYTSSIDSITAPRPLRHFDKQIANSSRNLNFRTIFPSFPFDFLLEVCEYMNDGIMSNPSKIGNPKKNLEMRFRSFFMVRKFCLWRKFFGKLRQKRQKNLRIHSLWLA